MKRQAESDRVVLRPERTDSPEGVVQDIYDPSAPVRQEE